MKNNLQQTFLKRLSSEKASISVDFLFSFLVVMGFTYLILALSFTLSFIEITQYITFSSARAYYASHRTEQEQRQQAENKYNELIQKKAWQHFFNKISWFQIDKAEDIIVVGSQNSGSANKADGQPEMYTGASTKFISTLLAFNLPLLGSSVKESEDETPGFKTRISSYLGRAPSLEECQKFNKERETHLTALCLKKDYRCTIITIADNGC